MNTYRVVVEIADPLTQPKKFYSPRVFLGDPIICDYKYVSSFVSHCQIVFGKDSKAPLQEQKVAISCKKYEMHPIRDILWVLGRFLKIIK